MPPPRIDLFSDIVCPWCYIGSERLERVLASLPEGERPEVTYHPFLLHPEAPPEGLNIRQMLREKYGRDPQQLFGVVEAAAHQSGIPLDLSQVPFSYSTVAAHTLSRHAANKGTQLPLMRDLFRAHFREGRNVSDPATLSQLATQHGFAASEVEEILGNPKELEQTLQAAAEASAQGIRGVPFFVFGEKFAISGAQAEEVLQAALEKARSAAG